MPVFPLTGAKPPLCPSTIASVPMVKKEEPRWYPDRELGGRVLEKISSKGNYLAPMRITRKPCDYRRGCRGSSTITAAVVPSADLSRLFALSLSNGFSVLPE